MSKTENCRECRFPGCSTLSGFVVRFHSYYYFSLGVPFFQIPDTLRDFTQPVALVDDRRYLSSRHELAQDGQVLFGYSRNKGHELLANEPRRHHRFERTNP